MDSFAGNELYLTLGITGAVLCITIVAMLGSLIIFIPLIKKAIGAMSGMDQAAKLRATGLDAQGVIQAIQDTGTLINYNPLVQISMEVHHPDGSKYTVTFSQVVSQIHIPQIQPGNQLPIKVDPNNREKVALLF